jgi:hypothetical protein
MLISFLLAACDGAPDTLHLPSAAPPPTLQWELPEPYESPCRTGCLTGADGALYASAYESDRVPAPFLRGTLDAATGQLTWSPVATPGYNAWRVLHAADIDADGAEEWLAARRDGTGALEIEVYAPQMALLQRTIPLDVSATDVYLTDLRTLQDDGDPALEFLLVGMNDAWVIDDDGAVLRSLVAPDCDDAPLRMTLLDTLGGPELITCDGVLYDVDFQLLADLPASVRQAFAVDANGDGVDDVVLSPDDTTWRLVDGATGRVRWTTTLPRRAVDTLLYDLDADGEEELVFAVHSLAGHGLIGLDLRDGRRTHAVPMGRPTLLPTALHRFDHDFDGVDSLLVVGLTNSGVFGWQSLGGLPEPTWGQIDGNPEFSNYTVIGDFHPAPGPEIALIGKGQPAYEVVLFDLAGQQLSATPFWRGATRAGDAVEAADLDGDGYDELAVLTRDQRVEVLRLQPAVEVIDLQAEDLFDAGDVNGDGRDELLVRRAGIVQLVRPGQPALPYPALPGRVALYDLNGDGRDELLCPNSSIGLEVRDGLTGAITQFLPGPVSEVVAGTSLQGDTRVWGKSYPDKALVAWDVQGGVLVPAWAPPFGVTSWAGNLLPVGDGVLVLGDGGLTRFIDPGNQTILPLASVSRPLQAHAAALPDFIASDGAQSTKAWSVP